MMSAAYVAQVRAANSIIITRTVYQSSDSFVHIVRESRAVMQHIVAYQTLSWRQTVMKYIWRIAGQERLQKTHGLLRHDVLLPHDGARARGITHVQISRDVHREYRSGRGGARFLARLGFGPGGLWLRGHTRQ